MPQSKNILERLAAGPVLGDGGFVFALEKRGFVKAGPWTPEASVDNPQAVKQLHTEFCRAGSDVLQTFTFYASEDKLENRGHTAGAHGAAAVNKAACDIAHEIADQFDCMVAGGICQTPNYLTLGDAGKDTVKQMFRGQVEVFKAENVDFMICEYFEHVEEAILAIEVVKEVMPGTPVAANLCIGKFGDMYGRSPGECAVLLHKAGADIIGLNCHFGPLELLEGMALMKEGLEGAGIEINKDVFLMCQPLAYHTPDATRQGFIDLPEFPFALEPRVCTRWDMHKFARDAFDMGIRYIGGCCGFEPYHMRAVSEELEAERGGKVCLASEKCHEKWGGGLEMHTKPWVRQRAKKEFWQNIKPASGRPDCSSTSKPDEWGVTAGNAKLVQGVEMRGQNPSKD